MDAITFKPTPKQEETLGYLMDKTTKQVLFGGGAGGSKSYLGCAWLIMNCLAYPGTRWIMGRAVLKSLKKSTLNTFFDVVKEWSLKKDVHWKLNNIDGEIKFTNGSTILLMDLALYPADPEFDSLGSLEITGAFIDECNQITKKARDIVFSRIRYKLDEFGLTPKLLMTCNPAKNWVYSDFYLPDKKGELESYRKFIPALAKDNPHIPKAYIEALELLDERSKQRLLYGNWDYDDDPFALFDRDMIEMMFKHRLRGGERYLTVDVARKGADRTVYGIWDGYHLETIIAKPRTLVNEVVDDVISFERDFNVPRTHVIIDEDGVGGGVVDNLKGCVGFINNGRPDPVNGEVPNFQNRKTQCIYKLAEFVEAGKISVQDTEFRDIIIEELQQIKQIDVEKDGKLKVTKKEDIKEAIGRSPDFLDMMMMRMISRNIVEQPKMRTNIVQQMNQVRRAFGQIGDTYT